MSVFHVSLRFGYNITYVFIFRWGCFFVGFFFFFFFRKFCICRNKIIVYFPPLHPTFPPPPPSPTTTSSTTTATVIIKAVVAAKQKHQSTSSTLPAGTVAREITLSRVVPAGVRSLQVAVGQVCGVGEDVEADLCVIARHHRHSRSRRIEELQRTCWGQARLAHSVYDARARAHVCVCVCVACS